MRTRKTMSRVAESKQLASIIDNDTVRAVHTYLHYTHCVIHIQH